MKLLFELLEVHCMSFNVTYLYIFRQSHNPKDHGRAGGATKGQPAARGRTALPRRGARVLREPGCAI